MREERRTAALAWAESVLGRIAPEELKDRPWAATWRIRHERRDLFLKASTARTGHEAAVLTVLTRVCPDRVPELVAADPAGHRLIVASAGTVLRERSPVRTFDLAVWIPLVQRFAQLQRRVEPSVDELLAHGVPDERRHRYTPMLRAFTTAPQLPDAERSRLSVVADHWEIEDARTSGWVGPSIQHGDLHDNNVAVDSDGAARFFDFGDASVAHPFSTLDLPRLFARADGVDAAGIARLEDAYLDVFTDLAPRPLLRQELHDVIARAPVQRAHNWLRALSLDPPAAESAPVQWDPAAAADWNHPIEYWLSTIR